jgi:ubiquinol-cytochrome c reductase cytochrome c subunit
MTRRLVVVSAVLVAGLVLAPGAAPGSAPDGQPSGQELYGRYCISCHGAAGAGVPPQSGATGNPGGTGGARAVTGPPLRGVGARAADLYLRTGYMPLLDVGEQPTSKSAGERLLDDHQIDVLVRYVASLGDGPAVPAPRPEEGNVAEGMRLFTDHCAGCHQIAATGGYVTGSVAPSLAGAGAVRIAEAVRVGPYVMPSFSERVIPDAQLNSLIAYVLSAHDPNDAGGWGIGHIGPVPEGMVTWLLAAAALVGTCVVVAQRRGRS